MGVEQYPHVFQPIAIGPVDVKNRFYVPPHGLHAMSVGGPHGSRVPSAAWAHYLAERAAGGAGLVFLTVTTHWRLPRIAAIFEESIDDYRAVTELVHGNGA